MSYDQSRRDDRLPGDGQYAHIAYPLTLFVCLGFWLLVGYRLAQ